jgi:hypothetical protein
VVAVSLDLRWAQWLTITRQESGTSKATCHFTQGAALKSLLKNPATSAKMGQPPIP